MVAVCDRSMMVRCTWSSLPVERHAADQVGLVLLLGERARELGGGALVGEREHRGAAHVRAREGVGVDRDEQVGLDLARLLDARVERQEVVAVAGEQGAHVRLGVDQRLQALGDASA